MRKIITFLICFVVLFGVLKKLYSANEWLWTPESGKWISEKDIEKKSARLRYEKARGYEEMGDVKRAIREYGRVVRSYPSSVYAPDAQYMVGILHESEGNFYQAYKEYAKVADNYPSYKRFLEIIEREYMIANLYMAGEKMKIAGLAILPAQDKAIEIFEHIVRSAPFSSFAPRAQFSIGEIYMKIKRYAEAIPEYQKLINNYPESEYLVEAYYQMSLCCYMRSRSAQYDQTHTDTAVVTMKEFLKKFPKSKRVPEIKAKLSEMTERLASKSFEIAQFYEKDKSEEAAIIYYQDVINNYPGTQLAIKAEKKIDELVSKPTSKKYADKGSAEEGFMGKIAKLNPFANKEEVVADVKETQQPAKEEAGQAEKIEEPKAPQKPVEKKAWEFWKKDKEQEAARQEEQPASEKKKFWEFWKSDDQEKEIERPQDVKAPEVKKVVKKEKDEDYGKLKMRSGVAQEATAAKGPKTLDQAAEKEPTDEEIERELMSDDPVKLDKPQLYKTKASELVPPAAKAVKPEPVEAAAAQEPVQKVEEVKKEAVQAEKHIEPPQAAQPQVQTPKEVVPVVEEKAPEQKPALPVVEAEEEEPAGEPVQKTPAEHKEELVNQAAKTDISNEIRQALAARPVEAPESVSQAQGDVKGAVEFSSEPESAQIMDIKLVETDKVNKLVFVTSKPVQFSTYELKDPVRLMIAMKCPVFSKLNDRIDIGKAGVKSLRSHYRNKEEGDLGWQVNAIVLDFTGDAAYKVTSSDSTITVELSK